MLHRSFAALLLVAAVAALPSPAQAAACQGTTGVTVVVQFPDRTEVGCAPGDPANGFSALRGAGFAYTIVERFPGALCQIDAYPESACQNMPPASAYWRYWRASPGGDWVSSSYGAGSTNPKPGSFEGWRFGDNPPAPDYDIPAKPTPTPTAKPSSGAGPGSTAGPTSASTSTPGARSGRPTNGATPSVAGPQATQAGEEGPTPTASGSPTAGPSVDGATSSEPDSSGIAGAAAAGRLEGGEAKAVGSRSDGNRSWIAGVLLVGVLGAAAGTTAVRRRRG